MLIGAPPPSPGPPPRREREGGEREGGPPRPSREEGVGERREGGGGEGPGLDWTEKGSIPLHGGGKGWGRGRKWEKVKAGPICREEGQGMQDTDRQTDRQKYREAEEGKGDWMDEQKGMGKQKRQVVSDLEFRPS